LSLSVNPTTTTTTADGLDRADPLSRFREHFHIPRRGDGELAYFVGNSLGLQPKAAAAAVQAELDTWRDLAVEGHFRGERPWLRYLELMNAPLAELVGAQNIEVAAMNTLTVNLHLLMVSFYRPTTERPAILIEAGAFPSDWQAVESQIRFHGFEPAECLIEVQPDEANGTVSMQAIARAIELHGPRLALVLWPGVQYRTGQAFDLQEIARLAHAQGAQVGFDCAHAAGNLALALHDSNADFATWCHYKYVNAGPGAISGIFVHERHAHDHTLPRLTGWYGHKLSTRFQMAADFDPTPGAEGWAMSNPPILALASVRASLEIFRAAGGMAALRERSLRLTGYLEARIRDQLANVLEILTPAEPERRGCQLSLRVRGGREQGRALFEHLAAQGVLGDWREPDVIRISPAPLYNRFSEIDRLVLAVLNWRG
jgi:kynureninase